MKLSKIMNDIAERREWSKPLNRDTDLWITFFAAFSLAVGLAIGMSGNKDAQKPSQKITTETVPAYRSLSRE